MKTQKYTYILLLATLFFSCEDYLDEVEDFNALDQTDIFADINLAKDFLDGAYTFLISEVSAVAGGSDLLPGMTMSGEGHPGRQNNNVPERYASYAQGDYLTLMNLSSGGGATPHFASRYTLAWKGIRIVNTFLEFSELLISTTTQAEIDGLKGQAYFLRAHLYHGMTKRHGGLVYLKENLNLNDGFQVIRRESYASNLANMLEDLDKAIDLLPTSWPSENVGRPTKGAALALKSRLTLFAASPLVNTDNNQQPWVDAATAASDLINLGLYPLIDASNAINIDVDIDGADLFAPEPDALKAYRNIFVGPGISKEIPQGVIFSEVNEGFRGTGAILNPTPRIGLTSGFDIIKGNNTPTGIGATANFVAKFETKNGLAIEDDPSYNPQAPFINRDPRFYNAILFDGVPWIVTEAGPINNTGFVDLATLNEEGNIGIDLHDPATPANRLWQVRNTTGYRIRKWVPNGAFWRSGSNGNWDFHVNNNLFRMAEVYLNYAEAANEAYGPNGIAPGATLTAVEAVNIVRNRVGMPNVNATYTSSKERLRERIRNERAVELCFEGIRYDDLRRWKIAHLEENKKVEYLKMRWTGGTSANFPTGFSYENEEQNELKKTFNENHYWWPIPSSELESVPEFGQTPGW